MDHVRVTVPTPTAPPPSRVPRSRFLRLGHALLAPVRFAGRRPGRVAALVVLAIAVASLLAAGGVAYYFHASLRAAREAVHRGHNAVAHRHLTACANIWAEHREVLILSARVARRAGSPEEVEALLGRYSQLYGDDDALVAERLLVRAAQGELEGTAQLLAPRAEGDGPDAVAAREALITGMLYRFRWNEAERSIVTWLGRAPDDPTAILLRGKLEEQRQQTPEAIRSYRRVLELDPEHDEARLRLTTSLLLLRQGEEALANLVYLRHRLPDNAEVHVQWSRALALQGRADEARAALAECLRAHPDFPSAVADFGKYALADGDDALALEYLGRAVRLDPGNVSVRQPYAQLLARSGRAAEAAQEVATIRQLEADAERITVLVEGPLQTRPNDPAVPHELGLISLRAGQPDEAERWFRNALRVDPNYAPTHETLATYYHHGGQPILAAKHRALARQTTAR